MSEFVLVSCSKSKLKGTHRAGRLYEPSDIFGKRKRVAKKLLPDPERWGILSAKYGYLRPWDTIPYYEKHITERTNVWGAFVLQDLLPDLEFYGVETVAFLAGERYISPLVSELTRRGYDVSDPNEGLRPGERKAALKETLAPGNQATLGEIA